MAIIDPIETFLDALVSIANADTELRALFVRDSRIMVPWENLDVSPTLPILLYLPSTALPYYTNVSRIEVQFSAFGATRSVVNKAVARLNTVLVTPQFTALGLDVARDPDSPPVRRWPSADDLIADTADARADITLTFLITA